MQISCFLRVPFFFFSPHQTPETWMQTHTHAHTVTVSLVSPCPTASPCWAEWWPVWDASGIRPHWTTDYVPQTSHSSGTCTGKHREEESDWCIYHLLENIFVSGILQMAYLSYSSISIQVQLLTSPNIKVLLHVNLFFKHLFRQTQWYYINSSFAKKQLSANVEPALPQIDIH